MPADHPEDAHPAAGSSGSISLSPFPLACLRSHLTRRVLARRDRSCPCRSWGCGGCTRPAPAAFAAFPSAAPGHAPFLDTGGKGRARWLFLPWSIGTKLAISSYLGTWVYINWAVASGWGEIPSRGVFLKEILWSRAQRLSRTINTFALSLI